MEKVIRKFAVAGINQDGRSDLFFVKLLGLPDQFEDDFSEDADNAATQAAIEAGYDSDNLVAFDCEADLPGTELCKLFDWDSIPDEEAYRI